MNYHNNKKQLPDHCIPTATKNNGCHDGNITALASVPTSKTSRGNTSLHYLTKPLHLPAIKMTFLIILILPSTTQKLSGNVN
jgi:hypothetical protein